MAKYQKYAECKDSGVEWLGEIPSHWEIWKLSHAYNEIGSGTTPSTSNEENFEGDIPWITTGELRENVILDTKKKVSQRTIELFPTLRKYPIGSVAIAMYGATIGRLGILGVEATTNQACCVMTISKVLNNTYVFYWLQAFKNEIIQLSSGGGQPNINQEKVASLKISAPTVKDQINIIDFLDHETAKIDSLIAKQEKLIELLKEKRQAVISHAVTKGLNPDVAMKDSGVEWLGQVPEHWIVKRLKYLCKVTTGSKDTVNSIDDGKYPFFVRSQTVERINSVGANCEAVLTAGDGAGVGKVYHYYNGKFDFHQRVYMLYDFSSITGRFVYYYLSSNFYKVALEGNAKSTVDSLRLPQFLNFEFAVPSKLEQNSIVDLLEHKTAKIDSLIEKQQQQIKLMQERRTALISAAVTGKIDVRNWQNPTEAKMEFSA